MILRVLRSIRTPSVIKKYASTYPGDLGIFSDLLLNEGVAGWHGLATNLGTRSPKLRQSHANGV